MDEVLTVIENALARLNTCNAAETAASLCGIIFRTGMHLYPPAELIRSIEMRMPAPSEAQAELASITGNSEGLCMMRAVGAFGDKLVCFVPEKALSNGFYFTGDFQVISCKQDAKVPTPTWDILRPAQRRVAA
jgi:hypothetical protein